MAISHQIVDRARQHDGACYVTVDYTDDAGRVHRKVEFAPAGIDVSAMVAAHAQDFERALRRREIEDAVDGEGRMRLAHATKGQLLAAWRERFRASEGDDTVRLAARMQEWIDAGAVTDADLDKLTTLPLATVKAAISDRASIHRAAKMQTGVG